MKPVLFPYWRHGTPDIDIEPQWETYLSAVKLIQQFEAPDANYVDVNFVLGSELSRVLGSTVSELIAESTGVKPVNTTLDGGELPYGLALVDGHLVGKGFYGTPIYQDGLKLRHFNTSWMESTWHTTVASVFFRGSVAVRARPSTRKSPGQTDSQ
jgi:hypothetical protein